MKQTKTIDGDIMLAPYNASVKEPYPPADELARLKAETFALVDEHGIEPGKWYAASRRLPNADGEMVTVWQLIKLNVRDSTGEGRDSAWPVGEPIYFWDEARHCIAKNEGENLANKNFPILGFAARDNAVAVADILNEENAAPVGYRN